MRPLEGAAFAWDTSDHDWLESRGEPVRYSVRMIGSSSPVDAHAPDNRAAVDAEPKRPAFEGWIKLQLIDLQRPHDETLGRMSHKIERITGHKGQNFLIGRGVQNRNVRGIDNFD